MYYPAQLKQWTLEITSRIYGKSDISVDKLIEESKKLYNYVYDPVNELDSLEAIIATYTDRKKELDAVALVPASNKEAA